MPSASVRSVEEEEKNSRGHKIELAHKNQQPVSQLKETHGYGQERGELSKDDGIDGVFSGFLEG